MNELKLPKGAKEIKGIIRVGGYWYWNWKFPFRHFKKERSIICTSNRIYYYQIK